LGIILWSQAPLSASISDPPEGYLRRSVATSAFVDIGASPHTFVHGNALYILVPPAGLKDVGFGYIAHHPARLFAEHEKHHNGPVDFTHEEALQNPGEPAQNKGLICVVEIDGWKDPIEIPVEVRLLPVQIKVSSANSPTGSDPKYTVTPEIPKKGNADNLFSVWPEEDFTVKVKLPESFQLPPNLIKWNVPGENIPDNAKEHTFNWTAVGTKRIEVQIGESKFEIWVDVPHVGDVGQAQAIATMPPWATAQIGAWAVFAQDYCNANYPVSPKRDAIRHSYWCALSASDGYVTQDQILYFATAHEFDDKWNDTPREQAFNSTMDLWNNFVGSTVNISHPTLPPTPNITQILQTLEQKYSAGELRRYDGSTSEGESEGIILKSNGTKIHPVN
jgi:hypothetical protein